MSRLVIVANRAATAETRDLLTDALRGVMDKHPGLWFGWNGAVARSQKQRIQTQQRYDTFTLHSWEMTPNEYDNVYHGYVHRVLWPVFHNRPDLARYQKEWFITYKTYTRMVAERVMAETRPDDVIWVQDYHLLPVGRVMRESGATHRCGFFLHQPFPPGDVFRTLPEHDWLLNCFLHYDLLGFQSSNDVNNFIAYLLRHYRAERLTEETLKVNGHILTVGIFPCGIATDRARDEHVALPQTDAVPMDNLRSTIISHDVISDISGIDYRLDALRTFLTQYPAFRRNVSLVQLADPLQEYPLATPELCSKLERFCGEINGQYGDFSWYPVNYIHNNLCSRQLINTLYRHAQVALFTPLSDGMHLGAKAFILAQDPADPGVLILSQFTGAAEQLSDALLVNPYDACAISEALHSALSMPLAERKRRHSRLLEKVKRYDCHWWGDTFIRALTATAVVAPPRFACTHYGIFTAQRLY